MTKKKQQYNNKLVTFSLASIQLAVKKWQLSTESETGLTFGPTSPKHNLHHVFYSVTFSFDPQPLPSFALRDVDYRVASIKL